MALLLDGTATRMSACRPRKRRPAAKTHSPCSHLRTCFCAVCSFADRAVKSRRVAETWRKEAAERAIPCFRADAAKCCRWKRTALMRPPPDLLLRGGQLAPALANERMQLGLEVPAEVDQRRQRAFAEVRMRRRRHAGDADAGRSDGHLQIGIVALVALERPALAHAPDVRPLVSGLDGVLDEVRPQPHARVELVLDLVQRGALVPEGHVV